MGIDASIPLQVKLPQFDNPLNQLAQFSQIQNAQNQNQLAQYTLSKARREDEDTQAVRNLLTGAGGDLEAGKNALYKGGYYKQALELGKTQLEQQEKQSIIKKNEASAGETQNKITVQQMETLGQTLGALQTMPNISPQIVATAIQHHGHMFGIPADRVAASVASVPQDPAQLKAFLNMKLMAVTKAADQMRYTMPDANAQLQANTSLTTAGMNNATTQRGQNMTQETAIRGQNITQAGQNAPVFNADAGGFISKPNAANPNGAITPLPGFNKGTAASEDERKAAGWFAQADNAWKNMQSVMLTKDGKGLSMDVVKPGVLENSAQGAGLAQTANWLRSADRQKFVQGASSLGEALLRAATGAGMNVYEAKQKVDEITPTLNDSDEVMRQKLASIPVYMESLKARAGRALPKGIDLSSVRPGTGDFNTVMEDARRIGDLRNKSKAASAAPTLPAGWSVKEN